MDEKRILQVRDRRKGRWDSNTILDELFSLVKRYQIQDFFLESENIAKALGSQIYERMRKDNVYFTLHPMTPSKDKETRASPLQAMTRAGGVKFPVEAEWFPDLKRNMLQFPRGAYKDDVDSLGLMAYGVQNWSLRLPMQNLQKRNTEMTSGRWDSGAHNLQVTKCALKK